MKITPSMVTLWHVAATITGGVMLPILLGLVQYVSSHGANVGQDISYGIPVLIGGLATLPVSIWHAVKANPALPQAEADVSNQAVAEVKNMAHEALTRIENIWPVLHDLNTRQTAQEAAQKAATPVVAAPYKITDAPASMAQVPVGPTAMYAQSVTASTASPQFSLPQRSFTQSALIPAVPKQ